MLSIPAELRYTKSPTAAAPSSANSTVLTALRRAGLPAETIYTTVLTAIAPVTASMRPAAIINTVAAPNEVLAMRFGIWKRK